jgi:hypothetical protein
MNAKALVMLQDLARSRGLLAKGRRDVRSLKKPASRGPAAKTLVRMNGLGHADPLVLVREAELACRLLMNAQKHFSKMEWHSSIESYFKAAAIATNVIFTSKVEHLPIPQAVVADMDTVISKSTEGIKHVMKAVAAKSMIHHEKSFHKAQDTRKKGAAAFLKKLKKGGVS